MERLKQRAEQAISTPEEYRRLLEEIDSMDPEERAALTSVVEAIEQRITSEENDPNTRRKAGVWSAVLHVLTMGLDLSAQALIHKTIGPGTSREIVRARIEGIKDALGKLRNR